MSDTPRTDAEIEDLHYAGSCGELGEAKQAVSAHFARMLERELIAATRLLKNPDPSSVPRRPNTDSAAQPSDETKGDACHGGGPSGCVDN